MKMKKKIEGIDLIKKKNDDPMIDPMIDPMMIIFISFRPFFVMAVNEKSGSDTECTSPTMNRRR